MGKSYKGKTCTYCGAGGASQSGDHVFARQLFPVEHRANLPQVPACEPCNRAKSELEHYLLTLLPFGGTHANSLGLLTATVPGRLAKNLRLHRELGHERGRALLNENGFIRSAMTLPFEGEKFLSLFRFIVRGLAAYHWRVQIPESHAVGAAVLTNAAVPFVEPFLRGAAAGRVNEKLGGGLVEYEGVQAVDDPALTVWRFRVYGGIKLADDPRRTEETSDVIWGLSARSLLPGFE